jgi:ribonuclease BN (tRNA processing enzyme)
LTVVGPSGIAARYAAASEALFPNSTSLDRAFDLLFVEHAPGAAYELGDLRVTPFEVVHPSGAPPYALRFEYDGKVLAFSGDTKWVDNLIPAAQGADLFICECFSFSEQSGHHMTWRDIERNIERLGARRVMLTHMGPDMLAQRDTVRDPRVLLAEDGLSLDI